MEAKSNKDERLEIRLQSGMKKDLTAKAKEMDISRNQLVEDVLFDFLYK
jgi:predicted HicB family RNase H-like nuclease